jgi:large subunit ribosomal protein L4
MEARAYRTDGTPHSTGVELPTTPFDGTVNEAVLHQVVTALRAHARQGTAATKTRGFVSGGTRKPWRQKGTGRARHGTIRSPIWRGGGIVFGPSPRPYDPRIPKKVRQLATRSALNARALEESLVVIDPFELEAPKTKAVVKLLERLEVGGSNALILTDGLKRSVYLSTRNIPNALVRPWGEASAYDVLWADVVIVEASALGESEIAAEESDAAEEES